ncbi:MAG: YqgE/AlgH family protein [Blastopirellula sp. JB062]
MQSLQGQLLVASPHLPDPNFLRTVILMVQHDAEGALGLVLTRPTELSLAELWQEVAAEEIDDHSLVLLGGPVQGPLMAVHSHSAASEIEILPGLYFSSEKENLETLVREKHEPKRLFIGYSGWGQQQLEAEMEAGGWLTLPAEAAHVFTTDVERLWKDVTGAIGAEIMRSTLHLKGMPNDPTMN